MNSNKPMICLSSFSFIRYLLYAVIFLTSTMSISTSFGGGNDTDHQALLKIKSMIQDPYGALTSWNNSQHFCYWNGVHCERRQRRVTYLSLPSQGLEGTLSPHVGNLSFLRGISFFNNSFQGVIPHELGRLYMLCSLYLDVNRFNGVIPTNLSGCSNLEALGLSVNGLVGSIPKEINILSKLVNVSLGDNKLTGGISPFLGNITSMEIFSVSNNPLGGSIPDTLGYWKRLKRIDFGLCNIHGAIPHSLYNLSLIVDFSLYENQLIDRLPLAIGTMLPHLVAIHLWGNQLTGPLPPSFSNCSRLKTLDMGENKFSGKLTIDFGKLGDIIIINIPSNNFGTDEPSEMKFLDSMKNCNKLKHLTLGECNFQGMLPKSIGNLSNQLVSLFLNDNKLHGNIPSSIGNLVGLKEIHLGGNQFTGSIPSTIGNIKRLEIIYMYDNQLSGQIPDAIGNLSTLIAFSVFSNKLEGVIPSSLGNCHCLLKLKLYDNKLKGKIPIKLLQLSSLSVKLDVSQNNLSGSLSKEIGDLKMLTELNLSHNKLSGNIPGTLGSCISLNFLSLKANLFQGTIPPSLGSLRGLVELDISHNNFSGQIPNFLEHLQYLDLSYNNFEGEVPTSGVFTNASAFSILGNDRLCGGLVELRLPKCKEIKKQKKQFPLYAIIILIAFTFFFILCLAYAWCKKKRKIPLSQSIMSERFIKVSYNQLLKATNGFSETNLIGNGGFSSVYKGILNEDDDRFVAIKVLHLHNQGAQRSFMRECEAWQNIRHRNLLKIITSCSSIDLQGNDFKALVYEFMPNGSLHDWVHSSESTSRLSVLQIINILLDVASALDYIHNHCIPSVVHGDLKPSNILLDAEMVAHVGDFGLARFIGTSSWKKNSTGFRGTIGYVAPEYGLGNKMSSSGDIYSFGILLLEVMTGKNQRITSLKMALAFKNFLPWLCKAMLQMLMLKF